ncbi:MAG: magnesium transporter [Planctomycetes bacterium]|nr:magnesium transporter [Planctomycetota bacterium]
MPDKSSRQSIDDLQSALASSDSQAIVDFLDSAEPAEAVHAISHLSEADQSRLLKSLSWEEAADLVDDLPEEQAARMIERLTVDEAAAIVSEMPSNERADVIARLPELEASAILDAMPLAYSRAARRLMSYPADSAGGLMITEYLSYHEHQTIGDVLDDLRIHADRYRRYDVQYAYVVADGGKLVGVLRLRDLLLSAPDDRLSAAMIREPLSVCDTAQLEVLERFFGRHTLFGVPAVDDDGRLVGVVRSTDVEQAAAERSSRSFLKIMGIVGGDELRSMPLRIRSMRRLSWLSVNILLNIVAASVIAFHQDTLAAVIALAVFLPIISDMSGCSGNQAVAVTMRELALGFINPSDLWRVLGKEAAVGVINGLALGVLLGLVGWLWQGNVMLGVVVAAALAINTLVAVCFGGSIPLVLRALGQDPALASGPILTTITDMSGFFLVLTLAGAVLPYLTS